MKLHCHLGVSYNLARRMRHKLMQVMMDRDREHPLVDSIQLDDAYLGGERSGVKRGGGAPDKPPFMAAVETNDERHPLRMKLTVVEGFCLTEIAAWAQRHRSSARGSSPMAWPASGTLPRRAVLNGFSNSTISTIRQRSSVLRAPLADGVYFR